MVLYTAKQAARHLEKGYSTVRKYCNKYRVGERIGNSWVLTDKDIQRLRDLFRMDPTDDE